MNDFNRSNKVSGIYWLKNDLNNLMIKVKLKPQNGIIFLPKFEDYSKRSNALNSENTTEEYVFKWQEKIFSRWEMHRYMDTHNCITETELHYHDLIKDTHQTSCKMFTYVDKDNYLPLSLDKDKMGDILKLESCLGHLSMNNSLRNIFRSDSNTVSTTHLFKSQENVNMEQEEWMTMHIMFDNSDYNEDSQLIYKQEVTLVSLYHNSTQNYLIITPDTNNLVLNPYTVETLSAVQWGYEYAVEIEFDDVVCSDELVMLLKKLYKRWERKQKHLLNFHMPVHGKRQYYVTLEILTAAKFDMDQLYIKFDVKVPEELDCKDIVQGRTHTSESVHTEEGDEWHFGHIVEFTIETDSRTDPVPVKLFLEAISSDWWGRHRTEGYTFLQIPLNPGCYTKELRCKRPEELNTVEANSRRFFLGGCHLIKDLNVLFEPQLEIANFTYTTTGIIVIRWNIISHCHIGAISSAIPDPKNGASTASALLKGAEAALHKYRRARARLAAVTEHLTDAQGSTQPLPN